MPKSTLLIASFIAVVAIIAVVFVYNSQNNTSTSKSSQTSSSEVKKDTDITVIDPNGEYKLFSDPSITKQPQKNAVFGNGQTITVEYNQSKGDAGSALFYRLYYVDKKGVVFQLADSTFETRNGNAYSTSGKVFRSEADGLNGFIEVFFVKDARISATAATGTQVKLGLYPIKFETDKS